MNSQPTWIETGYRIIGPDPMNALPHHDDSVEIIQFWSDGGFFVVKNNIFPIKPGSLLLVDATNTHYSIPAEQEKYIRSKVIVPRSFFDKLVSLWNLEIFIREHLLIAGGHMFPMPPAGRSATRIDQLMNRLARLAENDHGAQLQLVTLLGQLFETLMDAPVKTDDQSGLGTVDLMIQYVNEHLDAKSEIRTTDIAQALHISASRAAHLFKSLYGKTLTQYSNELRIAEAKKLLLTSQMKIMDISDAMGFHNPTIFCKYFKKYAGCTPRQYRDSGGTVSK